MLTKKPAVSTKPTVALVFADGVIVDGGGGAGGLTGGATVGSDTIRAAMREVARDDAVKAVVIRINSPGGSALASEAMWQAVRRVAKDKPVVISVGNMAASGGYYLACAGDRIFADPSAIVGSIGVVGGKFVTKGLYDKLGLTTDGFYRGRNADMFSSDTAFSDRQRRMVRDWMTATYDQFTQRVMTTRAGKIKNIADVAQGRVFVAAQAKDLGMVDEIGGLDAAVTYAAGQVDLPDRRVRRAAGAGPQDAGRPAHRRDRPVGRGGPAAEGRTVARFAPAGRPGRRPIHGRRAVADPAPAPGAAGRAGRPVRRPRQVSGHATLLHATPSGDARRPYRKAPMFALATTSYLALGNLLSGGGGLPVHARRRRHHRRDRDLLRAEDDRRQVSRTG